jgi:hypothetical protein
MARTTLGVVAGLAAWVTIGSIAGFIMRGAWPEYASVADTMTFTAADAVCAPGNRCTHNPHCGTGHSRHRPGIAARETHARCASARRVHPGAHHALGQVSCLVSPDVPRVARSPTYVGGKIAEARPLVPLQASGMGSPVQG